MIFGGAVASEQLRGVFAQVQRVHFVGLITEPATVRQALEHVGEPIMALEITPVRSPPLGMKITQRIAITGAFF